MVFVITVRMIIMGGVPAGGAVVVGPFAVTVEVRMIGDDGMVPLGGDLPGPVGDDLDDDMTGWTIPVSEDDVRSSEWTVVIHPGSMDEWLAMPFPVQYDHVVWLIRRACAAHRHDWRRAETMMIIHVMTAVSSGMEPRDALASVAGCFSVDGFDPSAPGSWSRLDDLGILRSPTMEDRAILEQGESTAIHAMVHDVADVDDDEMMGVLMHTIVKMSLMDSMAVDAELTRFDDAVDEADPEGPWSVEGLAAAITEMTGRGMQPTDDGFVAAVREWMAHNGVK